MSNTYSGAPVPKVAKALTGAELKVLIDQANAGLLALGTLYDHSFAGVDCVVSVLSAKNKIDNLRKAVSNISSGWTNGTWKLALPPKPALEPFMVGTNSWRVSHENTGLRIGCQTVTDLTEFRRMLCRFTGGRTEQEGFHLQGGTFYVFPGRLGLSVMYEGDSLGQVAWDEVERIIKAIESIE